MEDDESDCASPIPQPRRLLDHPYASRTLLEHKNSARLRYLPSCGAAGSAGGPGLTARLLSVTGPPSVPVPGQGVACGLSRASEQRKRLTRDQTKAERPVAEASAQRRCCCWCQYSDFCHLPSKDIANCRCYLWTKSANRQHIRVVRKGKVVASLWLRTKSF